MNKNIQGYFQICISVPLSWVWKNFSGNLFHRIGIKERKDLNYMEESFLDFMSTIK